MDHAALDLNDQQLLQRYVTDGDHDAFRVLMERHLPMVRAVAKRITRDDAGADDAAQTSFIELARQAAALGDGLGNPAGWLHKVAVRSACAAMRRRRRLVDLPVEAALPTAVSVPAEELHAALAELPERWRGPLVMHYLQGRSVDDIASALGVPTGTVAAWMHRGRGALRRKLHRRGITGASAALVPALQFLGQDVVPVTGGLSQRCAEAGALTTPAQVVGISTITTTLLMAGAITAALFSVGLGGWWAHAPATQVAPIATIFRVPAGEPPALAGDAVPLYAAAATALAAGDAVTARESIAQARRSTSWDWAGRSAWRSPISRTRATESLL